jgi:predicted flap endonuclease-1-like 5' DNA nuclease
MEEVIAVLLGTGAVVFSPFLIPGLRPVAKSAIKSSMAVADAAKSVASATTEGCREVANRASAALRPATKAAPVEGSEAAEATTVSAEVPAEGGASERTAAPIAVTLTPIINAIVGYGHTVAEAAAGIVAQAGKQWSHIVADAQAELKAEEAPHEAEALQVHAASESVVAGEAPVGITAVAEAAPAAVAAETVAAERADDLEQIDGIGPKVAAVLRQAGITTFDQLAAADPGQLKAVLVSANPRYRMFDPSTWPDQAQRLSEVPKG